MIAFALGSFLAAGFTWFWSNLPAITQLIGTMSVLLGAANVFVKKMVIAHPMSKFWLYVAHAFGPDPENALGKVVTFLDKLAFSRHRHDDEMPAPLVKRITQQVSVETPVKK